MPAAENEKKDLPKPKAKPGDELAAPLETLPVWLQKTVDFLKTNQNIFYAVATVVLLAFAIVKFRKMQREKNENAAATELATTTTVDGLKSLATKYDGMTVAPQIHFALADRLMAEQRYEEAVKEFEETSKRWPDSLCGKLAGARLGAARKDLEWKSGKEKEALDKLRAEGGIADDPDALRISDADSPRVSIKSPKGRIVIELDEAGAPNVVANFIRLIDKDGYKGTKVYKADKDAAIYAGDPLADGSTPRTFTIPFETSNAAYTAGLIAMVRDLPPEGQPDSDALKATASTHFVILQNDATALQGKFLAFGRVVEGIDLLGKLAPGDELTLKVIRRKSHLYEPKENPK